ncbi:hypothetical protein [Brevibacterium aurantiacum]|uniref:Uncharacterized protein n=1 Tax=Brevibacterium aurantiacum TaxID=273384 RepID=A0A2H1J7B4_BREAU|nr:hypothetical protein [Brevibacterium aurantiacum]SMX83366.1 hypothetical protein BAURA86_01394 [Brevibacterium aurantiacum]
MQISATDHQWEDRTSADSEETFDGQSFEAGIPPDESAGLAARFNHDGSYELWGYVDGWELTSEDLVLVEPSCRALSDFELLQVHEHLAPRALSYAAAGNDDARSRVLALTRFDLGAVMARRDEEEMLLFLRYVETGDTAPP